MSGSHLSVSRLEAYYGQFQALFGVEIDVRPGEIVSIIGANGAGKSTLIKSIAGHVPDWRGTITLGGKALNGYSTREIIGLGLGHVPEGRRLFASLSVDENLRLGLRAKADSRMRLNDIYELFPTLAERRRSRAGQLSGGQQQMVAIGRALLSDPKVLLCDEISIGLAPTIVEQFYSLLPAISSGGVSIVIVEQDIARSLRASSRFYCLLHGKVSLSGQSSAHSAETIAPYYLGSSR